MRILVQLLSYNNQPHLSKIIVPPETTVKQSKKLFRKKMKAGNSRKTPNDLIIKDEYKFDPVTNTILYPITKEENNQCEKQ